MNFEFMPEALGMAWGQSLAGLIGGLIIVLLIFWVIKSVYRAYEKLENQKEVTTLDWIKVGGKFGLLIVFVLFFVNVMQQTVVYGPKNSLRSEIKQFERSTEGEVKSLSPVRKTDEERLKEMEQNRTNHEKKLLDN